MCAFRTITLAALLLSISLSGAYAESEQLYVICDEWPPYQIKENNRISGFSTKMVKEVLNRMKITIVNIDVYPWKRALTMIEKGEADALFSANLTKDRTAYAFYPEETIISTPWVMWVREENKLDFISFDDLSGKKIGMVRGYSYTPELWNFLKKQDNYEEVQNDEINFKKLNGGRVDLIPAELGNGLHIVRKLNLNKVIPLMKNPLKTDGLYIMFNKNRISRSFVDRFSQELKKLKQDSFYKSLCNEYFGFYYELVNDSRP